MSRKLLWGKTQKFWSWTFKCNLNTQDAQIYGADFNIFNDNQQQQTGSYTEAFHKWIERLEKRCTQNLVSIHKNASVHVL